MPKALDLKGKKFNRLTCIKRVGTSNSRKAVWLCKCDCGKKVEVISSDVKSGHTKSCGCLKKEITSERMSTHNMSGTKEYGVWANMIQRCANQNRKDYKHYGGRGISVCERWKNFKNFYDDMGKIPDGKTLDRIDNDGDYLPDNCRWATRKTQANNSRFNKNISFNGKTRTVSQWAEKLNMKKITLYNRLNCWGWNIKESLTIPVLKNGQTKKAYISKYMEDKNES